MEQQVKFCQFCGAKQQGTEKFCGKCGKPLRSVRQQPAAQSRPQPVQKPAAAPVHRPPVVPVVLPKQKKDKKPVIIVVAVFGLTALMILIAVTAWLYLSHRSESTAVPEVGADEQYADTMTELADAVCENCPSERFEDVFPATWYHKAVDFVVTEGLMQGVSDTSFASNSNLTRAMMWTILARLDGVDTEDGSTWYEKGQRWAVENGVSDGRDFQDSITREQLATMVWRYLGEPAAEGDLEAFEDGGAVSDWAESAMVWASSEGVIRGKGGGVLDPQGHATRAEVAQIFLNYFG